MQRFAAHEPMCATKLDVNIPPLVGKTFICIWFFVWCSDRIVISINEGFGNLTSMFLSVLRYAFTSQLIWKLTKELDSRYSSQKDFFHKVFPWYGEAYDYENWQNISVLSPVLWETTHLFLVCILVQTHWKSHVAPSRAGGPSLKKSAEYPEAFATFVMRKHIAAWWSRGMLGTILGFLNMRCPYSF